MAWQFAQDATPSGSDVEVDFEVLYVGGAGDVQFVDKAGNTTTWTVAAGDYVLCGGTKIIDSGTDATNIIALS